jgi:hypothetical protein
MPTSEARINANRINSLKSCGPKTAEGKAISRRNGLKHGMTGQGVVALDEDAAEVERRHVTLKVEMAPQTLIGAVLIRELATLSVRMERGSRQEFATVGERVRHALENYDAEQLERAQQIMAGIADDPAGTVRRLKRTPSGVNLLVSNWEKVRADLAREPKPPWDSAWVVKVSRLMGLGQQDSHVVHLGAIYRAIWGNFAGLTDLEGAGLADEARKIWARDHLVMWADQEIDKLDAHYETLDLAAFARDRAEAPDRALFDPSKEATLARRYESEARRGFYRALQRFDKVETKVELETEVTPEPSVQPPASLASSCETTPGQASSPLELDPPPLWPPSASFSRADNFAWTPGGQILSVGKPGQGPARAPAPAR